LAYSPNGIAKGKLIYANYGRREDFEYLTNNLKMNLTGTIIIVRYGKIFRGVKAYLAEKLGVVGMIIYSDPIDDGFKKGPVFPNGIYRPESSLQRGTLMYNVYQGDPTTPDTASIPGTLNRIDRKDAKNLPQKILVLPLSSREAKYFLEKLDGNEVPTEWIGGIPEVNYKIGTTTNPYSVLMDLNNIEKIAPIYNVMTTIKGEVEPDRQVILGCHHDAWVRNKIKKDIRGSRSIVRINRIDRGSKGNRKNDGNRMEAKKDNNIYDMGCRRIWIDWINRVL
jgi:N-acetylated-alpha-linked acidic dipeptidase